jgi:hypothetical protein
MSPTAPVAHRAVGARTAPTRKLDVPGERVRQFVALDAAYRAHGGIVSADEVMLLLRRRGCEQPFSRLARWILARNVVSLEWQGATWLPLFQFDASVCVRPEAQAATLELADVLDEWELLTWFVAPSVWLDGSTPIEALAGRAQDVHAAARVDRFLARG